MTEFAEFIRDTGIRAVDALTARASDFTAPVRSLLRAWSKLSAEEKIEVFDALIETTLPAAPEPPKRRPAKKSASKKKTTRKSAKKL